MKLYNSLKLCQKLHYNRFTISTTTLAFHNHQSLFASYSMIWKHVSWCESLEFIKISYVLDLFLEWVKKQFHLSLIESKTAFCIQLKIITLLVENHPLQCFSIFLPKLLQKPSFDQVKYTLHFAKLCCIMQTMQAIQIFGLVKAYYHCQQLTLQIVHILYGKIHLQNEKHCIMGTIMPKPSNLLSKIGKICYG